MTILEITLLVLLLISLFFNAAFIKGMSHDSEMFKQLQRKLKEIHREHNSQTEDLKQLRTAYDALIEDFYKLTNSLHEIRRISSMDSKPHEVPNSP